MDEKQLNEVMTDFEAETEPLKKAAIANIIMNYYLFNQNNNEEGLKYAQIALQLAEEQKSEADICRYLNSVGVAYKRLNTLDKAKESYQRAILIGERLKNEQLIILPYTNLAMVHRLEQNYSIALDCLNRVLKASEQLGNQNQKVRILITIGGIYQDTEEYHKALQYYRQALRIQSVDDPQGFVSMMNLGLTYKALRDFSLAIGYLKHSLPLLLKVNHMSHIISVYSHIAECYISLSKYDKALIYAKKASDFVEEKQLTDSEVKCRIYLVFMRLYVARRNYEEMDYYIEKFKALNPKDHFILSEYYGLTHSYYEQIQRYDLAYHNIISLFDIKQIIYSEKMQNNLAIKSANLEYEREKIKTEILEQKNIELENYQHIIEQKNTELMKMHADKDNLMNTISHDLKNYLGAIQQARDILVIKEPTMLENKYMKIITSSTTRSLNLVIEILYSTKINASNDNLTLQTLDINNVIAENEDTLHLRGNKKGINVLFEYAEEPLFVQIDKEKWHRIFENLTTNAIKFSHPESNVIISTKKDGDFALISVKDSGIGIAPENIEKLFTPFSGVGRKGTDGEETTGLGLSIVKKLVELHNGTISVTSEVGKGTEFVVRLALVNGY